MKTFNLVFNVFSHKGHAPSGQIDLDIGEHGDIQGLWLDGHNYSDHGEVIDAIVRLVGPNTIQRLCSELASQGEEQ